MPFTDLNSHCMPSVTFTADTNDWCIAALKSEELSFSTLTKTHSPLYKHRQKHIQIKYIKRCRITREIKSSLFTIVCTMYDLLLIDMLFQQSHYVKKVFLLFSLKGCGHSSVLTCWFHLNVHVRKRETQKDFLVRLSL